MSENPQNTQVELQSSDNGFPSTLNFEVFPAPNTNDYSEAAKQAIKLPQKNSGRASKLYRDSDFDVFGVPSETQLSKWWFHTPKKAPWDSVPYINTPSIPFASAVSSSEVNLSDPSVLNLPVPKEKSRVRRFLEGWQKTLVDDEGVPYYNPPLTLDQAKHVYNTVFGAANTLDQWWGQTFEQLGKIDKYNRFNCVYFPYYGARRYELKYGDKSKRSSLMPDGHIPYSSTVSYVNPGAVLQPGTASSSRSDVPFLFQGVDEKTDEELSERYRNSPASVLLSDEYVTYDNPNIPFYKNFFVDVSPNDFEKIKHVQYAGIPYHPRLFSVEVPFEDLASDPKEAIKTFLMSGWHRNSHAAKGVYDFLEPAGSFYNDDDLSRLHEVEISNLSPSQKEEAYKEIYDDIAERIHSEQLELAKASSLAGLGLEFVNPFNAAANKALKGVYKAGTKEYKYLKSASDFLRKGHSVKGSLARATAVSLADNRFVNRLVFNSDGSLVNSFVCKSKSPVILDKGQWHTDSPLLYDVSPSLRHPYNLSYGTESIETLVRQAGDHAKNPWSAEMNVYGLVEGADGFPRKAKNTSSLRVLGFNADVAESDKYLLRIADKDAYAYKGTFRRFENDLAHAVNKHFTTDGIVFDKSDNVYWYLFRGKNTIPETIRLYNIFADSAEEYVQHGLLKKSEFVRVGDVPSLNGHLEKIRDAFHTLEKEMESSFSQQNFQHAMDSIISNFENKRIPKQLVAPLERSLLADIALPPVQEALVTLSHSASSPFFLAYKQFFRNFLGQNISAVVSEGGGILNPKDAAVMGVFLLERPASKFRNLINSAFGEDEFEKALRILLENSPDGHVSRADLSAYFVEKYKDRLSWIFNAMGEKEQSAFLRFSHNLTGSGLLNFDSPNKIVNSAYFGGPHSLRNRISSVNSAVDAVVKHPMKFFASTEDASRTAIFNWALANGMPPLEAMRLTNKHAYFYPRLTPAERKLFAFFPFSQYTVQNAIHNTEQSLLNPFFLTFHTKFKRYLEQDPANLIATGDNLGDLYKPLVSPLVQSLSNHNYNNDSSVVNIHYGGKTYSLNYGSFIPGSSDNLLGDNGVPGYFLKNFHPVADAFTKTFFNWSPRKFFSFDNYGKPRTDFDEKHPLNSYPRIFDFVSPKYSDQFKSGILSVPFVNDLVNTSLLAFPDYVSRRGSIPRDKAAVFLSDIGLTTRKYADDRVYTQAINNVTENAGVRLNNLVSLWNAKRQPNAPKHLDDAISREEQLLSRDFLAQAIMKQMRFLAKYSRTISPSSLYKTSNSEGNLNYEVSIDQSILKDLKESLDKELGKDAFANIAGYGTYFHAAVSNDNYLYYLDDEHKNKVYEIRSLLRHSIPSGSSGIDINYEYPLMLLDKEGHPHAHGYADFVATYTAPDGVKCASIVDIKTGDRLVPNKAVPPGSGFLVSSIDAVEKKDDMTIYSDGQLLAYAQALFDENPDIKRITITNYQGFKKQGYEPQYTVLDRDSLPPLYYSALERIYKHKRPISAFESHNEKREERKLSPESVQEVWRSLNRNLESLYIPHEGDYSLPSHIYAPVPPSK